MIDIMQLFSFRLNPKLEHFQSEVSLNWHFLKLKQNIYISFHLLWISVAKWHRQCKTFCKVTQIIWKWDCCKTEIQCENGAIANQSTESVKMVMSQTNTQCENGNVANWHRQCENGNATKWQRQYENSRLLQNVLTV